MTHDPDQHASLGAMYSDYFLDYASYVILERAVPHLNDGLKPVQRRPAVVGRQHLAAGGEGRALLQMQVGGDQGPVLDHPQGA